MVGIAHSVELRVPAAPEYLRTVRLVAADVATRAGFHVDGIEDVRLTADELCYAIGQTGTQEVLVVFTFTDGKVTVRGEVEGLRTAPALGAVSEAVVSAGADAYELWCDGTRAGFRFTKLVPAVVGG